MVTYLHKSCHVHIPKLETLKRILNKVFLWSHITKAMRTIVQKYNTNSDPGLSSRARGIVGGGRGCSDGIGSQPQNLLNIFPCIKRLFFASSRCQRRRGRQRNPHQNLHPPNILLWSKTIC